MAPPRSGLRSPPPTARRRWPGLLLAAALAVPGASATALELSWSGFGTLGYAVSNQPQAYQRVIDDDGTFARDSVLGLQADATFSPALGATLQLKLAPDTGHDSGWRPQVAWAFGAWRPANDWLLRLGKLRIPTLLATEQMDVGAAHDFARLPVEVYSVSPVFDFTGAALAKTWPLARGELGLDAYWGRAGTPWRVHVREAVPGRVAAGTQFQPLDARAAGLALTWRSGDSTLRIGHHQARVARGDGRLWLQAPVWLTPAPGITYPAVQPGPGVPGSPTMTLRILHLGADMALPQGWRVGGELARRRKDTAGGFSSDGAYLAVSRRLGAWTPYAYHARLRSTDEAIALWQALNADVVPAGVPGAALINAGQRAGADGLLVYDQSAWALGAAYALSPTSKVKAEWLRTHVGAGSSLVDAPPAGAAGLHIDVLSLNYSVVF